MTTSQPNKGERKEDRRRTARFPFVASAEVGEKSSSTQIKAQVSELSLYGCYLDIIHPFPEGAQIFVRIFTGADFFEASASVVYSHPNLGMGVTFRDVSPHFLPTLRKWLLEAARAGAGRES